MTAGSKTGTPANRSAGKRRTPTGDVFPPRAAAHVKSVLGTVHTLRAVTVSWSESNPAHGWPAGHELSGTLLVDLDVDGLSPSLHEVLMLWTATIPEHRADAVHRAADALAAIDAEVPAGPDHATRRAVAKALHDAACIRLGEAVLDALEPRIDRQRTRARAAIDLGSAGPLMPVDVDHVRMDVGLATLLADHLRASYKPSTDEPELRAEAILVHVKKRLMQSHMAAVDDAGDDHMAGDMGRQDLTITDVSGVCVMTQTIMLGDAGSSYDGRRLITPASIPDTVAYAAVGRTLGTTFDVPAAIARHVVTEVRRTKANASRKAWIIEIEPVLRPVSFIFD